MTEKLLQFPCDFPFKIMGKNQQEFEIEVLTIIRKHFSDLRETAISSRTSSDGNYLALTITVQAKSQEQLDAAYQELSSSMQVLMAL